MSFENDIERIFLLIEEEIFEEMTFGVSGLEQLTLKIKEDPTTL